MIKRADVLAVRRPAGSRVLSTGGEPWPAALPNVSAVPSMKMLLDPGKALRDLAPAWKRMEPMAEQMFWSSRYAHP